MRRLLTSMAVGVFLLCTGAAASGPEDKQHEPAQTEGILPLPDYGGDLWTRTVIRQPRARGEHEGLAVAMFRPQSPRTFLARSP